MEENVSADEEMWGKPCQLSERTGWCTVLSDLNLALHFPRRGPSTYCLLEDFPFLFLPRKLRENCLKMPRKSTFFV